MSLGIWFLSEDFVKTDDPWDGLVFMWLSMNTLYGIQNQAFHVVFA